MGNGAVRMPSHRGVASSSRENDGRSLSATVHGVIDCPQERNSPRSQQQQPPLFLCRSMSESCATKSIKSSLKKLFLFKSFDDDCLDKLANRFVPLNCEPGEVIIRENDDGDNMYFVESGEFDVSKNEESLCVCKLGDIFGELALLYNAKRSATVRSMMPGKLWALDRHTLREFQKRVTLKASQAIEAILKSVPLLKDLDRRQLSLAKNLATKVEYSKNDLIIRKGDVGDTFYIITEGTVFCTVNEDQLSPSHISLKSTSIDETSTINMSAISSSQQDDSNDGRLRRVVSTTDHKLKRPSQQRLSNDTAPLSEGNSLDSRSSVTDTNHLQKGDFFGEVALLTSGSLRTAHVIATSTVVKLLAFSRESFEKSLGSLKDIIDKRAFLRSLPLLEDFSHEKVERAIDMFTLEKYSQGDVMCKCGDPVSRIMVMRSGRASVWKHPRPSELTHLHSQEKTKASNLMKEHRKTMTGIQVIYLNDNVAAASPSLPGHSGDKTLESPHIISKDSQMNTFKMSSTSTWSASFANTELGQVELSWKRGIINHFKVDDSHKVSSSSGVALTTSSEYSNEIQSGNIVGLEAVRDKTPMATTVIAQGEVSCFVISEEDWKTLTEVNLISTVTDDETAHNHLESLHKELVDVDWNKLEVGRKLGSGTFGVVHLVKDPTTEKSYALKVLNKKHVKAKRQEKRVVTETRLLLTMKSVFVCRCFGANEDIDAYYLLMEILSGGELKSVIYPAKQEGREEQFQRALKGELAGIPAPAAKFYAAALAIPLMYLHRQKIAYRDLKPDNVVLDHNGYPKLIDFGLSKQLEDYTYTMCGTPQYLAPEIVLGTGHNQTVDWWALGVLIYEMVVGVQPFTDRVHSRTQSDPMVIFENIARHKIRYPKGLDENCKDLIVKLLAPKQSLRLGSSLWSFKVFEQHPWFENEVDWYALKMRRIPPPYVPQLDGSSTTQMQCVA